MLNSLYKFIYSVLFIFDTIVFPIHGINFGV